MLKLIKEQFNLEEKPKHTKKVFVSDIQKKYSFNNELAKIVHTKIWFYNVETKDNCAFKYEHANNHLSLAIRFLGLHGYDYHMNFLETNTEELIDFILKL